MAITISKMGEGAIAALFPYPLSAFAITFYGASGRGNAYIQLFKADGTVISSITLPNITNGPHGFQNPEPIIQGFTIHNDDPGGLAIYEIRYKANEATETWDYFYDSFLDP